ncbi:YceI family protein [Prosthecobacter sp.]|jgi:polyisoprenoid-binding protein YceI|uniref:YceI family protein n=1 Tax=Prosthecobacter sp. TaxID=1965333 RepID=UPI0037851234
MTTSELQTLLTSANAPLLVQVLPEEVFAARRIPGSKQACVYEVVFLDQIAALTTDKARAIIVYGAGSGSLDAKVAAEKLAAAGFTNVTAFEGGLDAWSAAGLHLEGEGALPAAPLLSGTFRADTEQSLIRWTGRNLFNHHSGTVRLAEGEIVLRDNALVAARFRIAMDSIACEDISDSAMNQMLIAHLHSDDFFDVAHHPVAEFTATSITPLATCTDGTPNYLLRGQFTLRGITREIEFPILVATADGQRLTAQGVLDLDRTQFGSVYGSGRLFRFLGKHIVNDHIHLHIKLHADLKS